LFSGCRDLSSFLTYIYFSTGLAATAELRLDKTKHTFTQNDQSYRDWSDLYFGDTTRRITAAIVWEGYFTFAVSHWSEKLLDRTPSSGAITKQPSTPILIFSLSYKGLTVSLLKELWFYARQRKKYWLIPILIVMILMGGLLVAAEGSVFAPFIYTLF
jgi:hypothetical protein